MENKLEPKIKKKKVKKKYRRHPIIIGISAICIILAVALSFQLLTLNIFPLMLSLPILTIFIVLSILCFLFYTYVSRRPITRFLSAFMIIILTVSYGLGNFYVHKMSGMFDSVTNLTDQMTNTISLLTLVGTEYTSLESLDNKKIGTVMIQDEEGTTKAIKDIDKTIDYERVDYDTFADLHDALYDGDVQGILLNETFRGIEFELDENFNNSTQPIHQTVFYTKRDNSGITKKDSVNVTRQPFTVLISGNDSYGGLTSNARSDLNMLVTVNPKTKVVLLTSIPRDLYKPIECGSLDTGLVCPQGQMDKLTHSGLYGIDATEKTLESALDIEINYNVRVNFSSLTNLVNALDGIDVFVEDGLAVDRFNADWSLPGVSEGWNHLDGKRALAFARERYAYQDGDAQRVRNQQIVIQAMVKKLASVDAIPRLGDFIDALSGAFETNMSSKEILSLARYEFTFFPKWKFENYSLYVLPSTEFSATTGTNLVVALANIDSLQVAHDKIEAVLKGKSSTEVSDQIDVNNFEMYSGAYVPESIPEYTEQYVEEIPQEYVEEEYSEEIY